MYNIHMLNKNIPKDILILTLLAVALNILRVVFFHAYSLIYILWNIFLAILPFVVSSILLKYVKARFGVKNINKLVFTILAISWLLLIPNAPYIVTDLIHIVRAKGVPVIYDTFLLFTSAWVGLLLGFYSLSHIEEIIRMKYSNRITITIISALIFLISFGLYLGRFLRFNSWDVFYNKAFYSGVWSTFSYTGNNSESFVFITLSFIFILFSYQAWKYRKAE